MKQVTVVTAKHTLNGAMYTWRISQEKLVELTMALTNHRQFILAVDTQYESKLVEYVGTRLEDSKTAKNHRKVQAVLVGYNHSTIKDFYDEDDDFIEDFEEEEENLNAYASKILPEEEFLEEEFEDIEE